MWREGPALTPMVPGATYDYWDCDAMLELRLAFHRGAYAIDKHNSDLHRNQEEQRCLAHKATVWVEFISPPSHVGKQIQLYPKIFEPKHGPAQGADFSLLTAIKANSL